MKRGVRSVLGEAYSDFSFAPADLAEDVDLPLHLKKEILYLDARLPALDHWQLLGLPWNAPVPGVRAAYLEKVKVFHPDRYAGHRLGSYRARMEHVLRSLTAARDELCDPARRAGYARKTAPPEELARLEARRLEDETRADERRARMSRSNPLLARAGRVRELIERGKRALDEGRYAQAATDLLTAAALDPRHLDARKLAEEARRRSTAERAQEMLQSARTAAALGNVQLALATLRQLVELEPGNVRHRIAAARLALESGALESARALAEEAAHAAPRDAAAAELLGEVLVSLGDTKGARRALERAVAIEPGLATAAALLKRLRWSFLR